jgi:hypothetical protein
LGLYRAVRANFPRSLFFVFEGLDSQGVLAPTFQDLGIAQDMGHWPILASSTASEERKGV